MEPYCENPFSKALIWYERSLLFVRNITGTLHDCVAIFIQNMNEYGKLFNIVNY